MNPTALNLEQQVEDAFYSLLDGKVEYTLYRAHTDNVTEIDGDGILIICESGDTRTIHGNWTVKVKILVFTAATNNVSDHVNEVSRVREAIFVEDLVDELQEANNQVMFIAVVDYNFQNLIENDVRTTINSVDLIIGQKSNVS